MYYERWLANLKEHTYYERWRVNCRARATTCPGDALYLLYSLKGNQHTCNRHHVHITVNQINIVFILTFSFLWLSASHPLFSEVCRKFLYKRKTLQHFFVTFRIFALFYETLFNSYLSQKSSCTFVFGNERRITISLAQIILIVTETYLYETFFSGKFAEFVYTLTSQVIDAHVLCNGIFCRCSDVSAGGTRN